MQPFLFSYSTPRLPAESLPGGYSDEIDMWVTQAGPIIDNASELLELATKTDTVTETDDQISNRILELETKTNTGVEGDDEVTKSLHCLEVTTKTKVDVESDDTAVETRKMFL